MHMQVRPDNYIAEESAMHQVKILKYFYKD